ncbi:hypothetical protein [Streptomyces sp. KL118A]|uniref:hypothetical protein n=1 Tax=Streptomyces sp. KL118A TaxID=3045153 RepID=UPI00278C4588|nr:hypothetical protein [Streptomyces sp. KL118A]
MHRAREKDTDRHVFRRHIGPPHDFGGDLICWKCTAPFGPVRAHTRKGKPVQAQYRLLAGEHDETCPLNPDTVTAHLAHGSQGLADVEASGVLRLNLPQRLDEVPLPGTDAEADVRDDVVRHSVTTVRPLLPPAVGTAAKIAQFLQLHDHDPEITSRFRVRPHDGRLIPWTDFCYGPRHDSYARLFARLRATPVLTHPIAVVGTVERVSRDSNYSPFALLAVDVPSQAGRFHVTIRSGFASLMEPLTVGTHVLAVGGWEIFARGSTPALRLWADAHWQLAFWRDDEAGTVTPPRSPAPVESQEQALDRWRKPAPRTDRPAAPETPPRPEPPHRPTALPDPAPKPAPSLAPSQVPSPAPEVLTSPAEPTPPAPEAPVLTPSADDEPQEPHSPPEAEERPSPHALPLPDQAPAPVSAEPAADSAPPPPRGLLPWLRRRRHRT